MKIPIKEATEDGYYWWLPACDEKLEFDPAAWSIIHLCTRLIPVTKKGWVVGPLMPPCCAKIYYDKVK